MKNFYIAVIVSENGKNYAHMIRVDEGTNLCCRLAGIQNIKAANICPTKTRAREIVEAWNEGFKKNGTYMFDETF